MPLTRTEEPEGWEPVSARTVSAILSHRQDASRQPVIEIETRREGEVREDYQRRSMEELTGILDELDAKAARALREWRNCPLGADRSPPPGNSRCPLALLSPVGRDVLIETPLSAAE
ncbi:MAG: hypothetical protein JWO29_2072 [Arthrobacter sp.]|nr:hypothetical protein [Arthrobacter sp.]